MSEQPFLGLTLLTSLEEKARKGALKIVCFISPWPAYRSWQGSHSCGRIIKTSKNKKGKTRALILGTWNVRTLQDNQKSERPERRTALVARGLGRYNVDIAALSEVRLPDKGQLTEQGGGYTFFWSGRDPDECMEVGICFVIKSNIAQKLIASKRNK